MPPEVLPEASITPPPLLPWSLATHAAFPARFRRAAIALLLCHKQLASQPPHGPPRHATAAALP